MPVVLWTTHEMKRSEASQSVKTILWLLTKKVAYMELDMVAEMEVDNVVGKKKKKTTGQHGVGHGGQQRGVDKVAATEVDMEADMEEDMVADIYIQSLLSFASLF